MLPISYLHRIKYGSLEANEVACLDCLHPRIISAYNADTQNENDIVVNCGKCVRCADNLRNEWAARMCLHSFDYKYCYFITLTYGNINLYDYETHPFKKSWLETYPVLDSNNYNHRPVYTPSILVHQHLTDFIKRLRQRCTLPLSYCACGEYGSSAKTDNSHGFGRPHFHLIIWSDELLTRDTISLAWSYDCYSVNDTCVTRWNGRQSDETKRFTFRIGNVYFENLTQKGALDWNGIQQNIRNNSRNCFTYVAKYVGKSARIPQNAENRIISAFICLQDSETKYDLEEPQHLDYINASSVDYDKYLNTQFKQITINKREYKCINYDEFKKIVSPFFVSSRARCIGKGYLLRNLDRFSQGSYQLPKFQGNRLAFPRYFARLVSQKKYPIRLRSHSVLGNSLVKCSLPRIYDYYMALRDSRDYYYYVKSLIRSSPALYSVLTDRIKASNRGFLYDVTFTEPIGNVRYTYIPHLDMFEGYKYSRHTRSFDLVDSLHREDFCDIVLDYIEQRAATIKDSENRRLQSLELHTLVQSDSLTSPRIADYQRYRESMQRDWLRDHYIHTDKQ